MLGVVQSPCVLHSGLKKVNVFKSWYLGVYEGIRHALVSIRVVMSWVAEEGKFWLRIWCVCFHVRLELSASSWRRRSEVCWSSNLVLSRTRSVMLLLSGEVQ